VSRWHHIPEDNILHSHGRENIKSYYRHCTYFFINMMLDHLLPSRQLQSLEWTCISFEQSLVQFYNILLEEHLQVALEMLEVGICCLI
jgi:hypothetical protein